MEKADNKEGSFASLAGINIVTADPKKLADFYKNILGAEIDETRGGPNRIEIWLGSPDERRVYIAANYDKDFIYRKYNACQGFELLVDDVDSHYNRIMQLGIEISAPPVNLPWGYRYFNIKDPDGNGIDIVQAI